LIAEHAAWAIEQIRARHDNRPSDLRTRAQPSNEAAIS